MAVVILSGARPPGAPQPGMHLGLPRGPWALALGGPPGFSVKSARCRVLAAWFGQRFLPHPTQDGCG